MKTRSNLENVTAFFESLWLRLGYFRPYKLVLDQPRTNGDIGFWGRLVKADRLKSFDTRVTERIQKWIH